MSSATDPVSPRTERLNTKAAGIIGLAVMCSRLLGLAREQIFAALFGGGAPQVLTVSATTGMPIKSVFRAQGNVPSSVSTFQVSRVTLAGVEAGKF